MNQFEWYLANVSFIAIPFFFYQLFWISRPKNFNKDLIMFAAASISALLCMRYPIHFGTGINFDLRNIVLILCVLYGNSYVSVPLYLLMVAYRFFMGGIGSYISLSSTTCLLLGLILYKKRYHTLALKKKVLYNISFAVGSALIVITVAFFISNESLFSFQKALLSLVLSEAIGMWLMTYFIETTLSNASLQKNMMMAEKLKAISELSASISHEVRNPLTVTKGFLQMLRDPDISLDSRQFYVKISLTELERAEMIINDYLALTKPHKEAVILANLEEDLGYVLNVIKPYSAIHNVNINHRIHNSLLVQYDQNQLRQCLINLMKNCIESMSMNGGTLNVEMVSDDNHVKIKIEDTGIGMTKEEVNRLGVPYYTTKEKGTGLGMMVAFSAIHAMNGKLNIESEKGKGTVFTIKLPSHQQK
ncbi:ATP-binding protein [Pullulanibacillus sp. KACC 23026]|uniref:ATP-binding protein n=1 Tax=Pullulanibacillus sp. KACC 23026 TaxID=3028315 RepID=UPI0023B0C9AA|nr:sensor histidine kinase [Pullulanibacillus sp. KACC 23026]WEG13213.1 ATP-binding protein [Pullulanibacillus sp. KACC 23026]